MSATTLQHPRADSGIEKNRNLHGGRLGRDGLHSDHVDPDLAVHVNRPGKRRAYGVRMEHAAWVDLNDRLRMPRVGAGGM